MSIVSATVTAVLFSIAAPDVEPEVFAAFFSEDAQATCEKMAATLNDQSIDGWRFYCE